jgi:hypothetical protein
LFISRLEFALSEAKGRQLPRRVGARRVRLRHYR